MELADEGGVKDVIFVDPGTFLRAVPLPVYQVLDLASMQSSLADLALDMPRCHPQARMGDLSHHLPPPPSDH